MKKTKKKTKKYHVRRESNTYSHQLYLTNCYIAKIQVIGDRVRVGRKPTLDQYDHSKNE